MTSLTTPLLISLTFATAFGVLIHDTQIDKATTIALAAPIALASFAIADLSSKSNDHVHVEKASAMNHLSALRGSIPKTPPRDDDRRYIQAKRIIFGGGGDTSLWPSV